MKTELKSDDCINQHYYNEAPPQDNLNAKAIAIIEYNPSFQPYFEKLNKFWLKEYFVIEPIDEKVLSNPQENIINGGGAILFATNDHEIIGTVALKSVSPEMMELTKMAVDRKSRGLGAGKLLCRAAINKARELGCKRLILYSNTILKPALHIYQTEGFKEITLEKGTYGRANIMMELSL